MSRELIAAAIEIYYAVVILVRQAGSRKSFKGQHD